MSPKKFAAYDEAARDRIEAEYQRLSDNAAAAHINDLFDDAKERRWVNAHKRLKAFRAQRAAVGPAASYFGFNFGGEGRPELFEGVYCAVRTGDRWSFEDRNGDRGKGSVPSNFFDGLVAGKKWLPFPGNPFAATSEIEALDVLRLVRFALGRNYKSAIRQAWMDGSYSAQCLAPWAGKLQCIRNTFGPSWLVRARP